MSTAADRNRGRRRGDSPATPFMIVVSGALPSALNLGFHALLATAAVLAILVRRRLLHEVVGVIAAAMFLVYIALLFARLDRCDLRALVNALTRLREERAEAPADGRAYFGGLPTRFELDDQPAFAVGDPLLDRRRGACDGRKTAAHGLEERRGRGVGARHRDEDVRGSDDARQLPVGDELDRDRVATKLADGSGHLVGCVFVASVVHRNVRALSRESEGDCATEPATSGSRPRLCPAASYLS